MSQIIGINLTMEQLASVVEKAVKSALPPAAAVPGQKRLLTQKDVAAEFGIKERMLEKWRSQGTGPEYTIVGRRPYYEREILESWIESGRVRTSAFAD